MESLVTVAREGLVGTVGLNRPAKRNALSMEMYDQLDRAVGDLERDDGIGAIVIRGEGSCFSAGIDLGSLFEGVAGALGGGPEALAGLIREMQARMNRIEECPKPVIAAVHGWCIGAGLDLAAACDIRLASADAVFSLREARLGIAADLGALQRVPAIVGAGHAREMAYTAGNVDATRAERIGLVNRLYPTWEELFAGAAALAAEIAANPAPAVRATKATLVAAARGTVADGLEFVLRQNVELFLQGKLTLPGM